jgi:hypothetical protein
MGDQFFEFMEGKIALRDRLAELAVKVLLDHDVRGMRLQCLARGVWFGNPSDVSGRVAGPVESE